MTSLEYEAHLLVWLAISCRGFSSSCIHRLEIALREETYLKQCLLLFIKRTKFLTYHYVRKVRATQIMFDRRRHLLNVLIFT